MAGSIIAPVINSIRDALNVAPSWAGLIITMHGLMVVVASPFIGKLIDKFGAKWLFGLGLLLYGLSGGAGMVINTYWLLIISRGFLGIAVAAIMTSITVIILGLYSGEQRNRVMGIRASSQSFGSVIWPLLGGFLGLYSWHLPFSIYTIAIPLCLATFLSIPEVHRVQQPADNSQHSVLAILRNQPVYVAIYAMMFMANIILYTMVVYLPPFLETIGVVNSIFIGSLLALYGMAAGITSLFYKRIRAWVHYRAIIVYVFLLWITGTLLIWRADNSTAIFVALALLGHGWGILNPTLNVWLGDLAPAAFRGRMISYLSSSGLLGQFLTPIIFAPVALWLTAQAVFLVAGMISFVLFVIYLVLVINKIRQ